MPPPNQRFSTLTADDEERLAQQRAAVERYLGDAFVQKCGWLWRMVEDEYGRDPCVKVPAAPSCSSL